MDFYIVNSSKGGIGKSLISLMATKNTLDKYSDSDKRVLLIDLNSMNPDCKSLLVSPKEVKSSDLQKVYTGIPYEEGDNDEIVLYTVEHKKYKNLSVGWLNETYFGFSPQTFFIFLEKLYAHLKQYRNEVSTVIIDSNYHIPNLFSRNSSAYTRTPLLTELFSENRFQLFLIWTYRQVLNFQSNLIFNPELVKENATLLGVIDQIEEHLCYDEFHQPLIHVFTPVIFSKATKATEIIKTYEQNAQNPSFKQKIFDYLDSFFNDVDDTSMVEEPIEVKKKTVTPKPKYSSKDSSKYVEIPCLKRLADMKATNEAMRFKIVVDSLLRNSILSEDSKRNRKVNQSERFESFLETLADSFLDEFGGRPVNIMPISTFEYALIGHTDKSNLDLNYFSNLFTYKLFSRFFDEL